MTWHELAACRGQDPALFVGQEKHPISQRRLKFVTKRYCSVCPVRAECLADFRPSEGNRISEIRAGRIVT